MNVLQEEVNNVDHLNLLLITFMKKQKRKNRKKNERWKLIWIKNKLPWYITKFCKISSTEMELRSTDILIGVNIGKSKSANCYIKITPRDIGWK